MFSNGTAGLLFLPIGTTMNGIRYRKTLEDKLEINPFVHRWSVFMQDGASFRRSKIVSNFFKITKTFDWPGSSLDLNPIENSWAILKEI